jgi:hypothetical protein
MRVRRAPAEVLAERTVIPARHGRITRAADDEGFLCPTCSFVLVVTRELADDPLSAFCCPQCSGYSVRT